MRYMYIRIRRERNFRVERKIYTIATDAVCVGDTQPPRTKNEAQKRGRKGANLGVILITLAVAGAFYRALAYIIVSEALYGCVSVGGSICITSPFRATFIGRNIPPRSSGCKYMHSWR